MVPVSPAVSEGFPVTFGDVTRAILRVLVDAHPEGIHARTLACMVDCEEGALIKELRLLHAIGAIEHAAKSEEVRLTEATLERARRSRGVG
jgi:hypothetical protein